MLGLEYIRLCRGRKVSKVRVFRYIGILLWFRQEYNWSRYV
jgi:hypothetical protein